MAVAKRRSEGVRTVTDKTPTDIFKRSLWLFFVCIGLSPLIFRGAESSAETIRLCKLNYKAEIIYYAPIGQEDVLWRGGEVLKDMTSVSQYCKVDSVRIVAHASTGIDHNIARTIAQRYLDALLRDLLDFGIDPAIVKSKYVGSFEPMVKIETSTAYVPENSRIEILVSYTAHIPKSVRYD